MTVEHKIITWLIIKGRYGEFKGCSNFPKCDLLINNLIKVELVIQKLSLF